MRVVDRDIERENISELFGRGDKSGCSRTKVILKASRILQSQLTRQVDTWMLPMRRVMDLILIQLEYAYVGLFLIDGPL